jgi:isoleucyl-tRNA synthetase
VVDEKGHMINSGKYDSIFYLKSQKDIVADLGKADALLYQTKFTHSHPID